MAACGSFFDTCAGKNRKHPFSISTSARWAINLLIIRREDDSLEFLTATAALEFEYGHEKPPLMTTAAVALTVFKLRSGAEYAGLY
jgi:hypothetical protein